MVFYGRLRKYLTHISINGCGVMFEHLEIFLRHISSQLQVLRVNVSADMTYLDANRWERLITNHLPYLRKFEFHYWKSDSYAHLFLLYGIPIDHFLSPFYIERRWLLQIEIDTFSNNSEITYSIYPNKYVKILFIFTYLSLFILEKNGMMMDNLSTIFNLYWHVAILANDINLTLEISILQ
jgi:hypothetical protein